MIKILIMQKVVQKSLKMTIIQQISQLNRNNIEFYALLRKLQQFNQTNSQTVNQRMEAIRLDIREKIKTLASNIDLLYQSFDKKITLILGQINSSLGNDLGKNQAKMISYEQTIKDLQQKNRAIQSRLQMISSQNEQLKHKNILLLQELEIASKKANRTNDSNQSANKSYSSKRQNEDVVSLEHRMINNDLTFNQKRYKTIKSEENSFSSVLVREQHSFEPNMEASNESSKFIFGCLPKNREEKSKSKIAFSGKGIKFVNKEIRNDQSRIQQGGEDMRKGQQHRLSFLINNLRQAHQTTLPSEHSFIKINPSQEAHEMSALSKGVVKKYMI